MEKIQRRIYMPLLAVMLVVAASAVVCAQAPTLTPLPWDNSLSIYVGHNGTWTNFNTGLGEVAEIADPVAAFTVNEQISDELDTWIAHQINDPEPPVGWTFFEPDVEQPMQMHVIVRDTQNRLAQVVVTDRNTGLVVGNLIADPAGAQVDGSLSVDPAVEGFNLEVISNASATLFKAGANTKKVNEAVAITLAYGWQPNRGIQHQPCPVTDQGAPWGDPRNTEGKLSTGAPMARAGCGPAVIDRDQPTGNPKGPLYELLNVQFPEGKVPPSLPNNLAGQASLDVAAAINAAKAPYLNGTAVFQSYPMKPYSRGTAHWPMTVTGEIKALLYVPIKDISKWTDALKIKAQGEVEANRADGIGKTNPSGSVAVVFTWPPPEHKVLGSPVAIGDIWALRVVATGNPNPVADPEQNITAPVTFELWGNMVAPDGQQGYMGGTGTANVGAAWTTPAPPPAIPQNPPLVFPNDGVNKGRVVVEVGKGWKWTATGTSSMMGAYSTGQAGPLNIDGPNILRVNINLQVLLTYKVRTKANVNGQVVNEPSTVQLERQDPVTTMWVTQGNGDTVTQNGEQIWQPAGHLQPGTTYRVRAKSRQGMMSPWTDWVPFGVLPAIERTDDITVVRQGMQ